MIYHFPERHYLIGNISFEDSINEISVDSKRNPKFKYSIKGNCSVEIFSNEGNSIPHFHIEGNDFSCCVYLFENRFFVHGKHKDTLNKKDWKTLDSWMRKSNSKFKDITNWEYAKRLWDYANGDSYMNNDNPPYTDEQPDYTTILPYKG